MGTMLPIVSLVLLAAQGCPAPELPAVCEALIPGTPLPYVNAAAPAILSLPDGTTDVDLVILGHSENGGYDPFLQSRVDADPPLQGVAFHVSNLYIGGVEAFKWATPGEPGWLQIESMLATFTANPVIVLGLFSNNTSFPAATPDLSDPNYAKFVADLDAIAEHVTSGANVLTLYLSAHRFKQSNFLPCWYENCALGAYLAQAQAAGKGDVKPGPEQHDLHWCCFPSCYASDLSHPNPQGDQLMAEAWHALLVRELSGSASVPFGQGTQNSFGTVPVLKPSGGFPKLGNDAFGLTTNHVPAGSTMAYGIGAAALPGPILVDPILVIPASSGGGIAHTLSLPIPATPSLAGVVLYCQSGFLDPPLAAGFALSQGLELHLGV